MLNNSFMIEQDSIKGPCELPNTKKIAHIEDPSGRDIYTSINIVGFFERLIEKGLLDILKENKFSVKPAFNNESQEDLGNPVVTVRKTSVESGDFGIMGDRNSINNISNIGDMKGISINDSFSVSDFFTMGISVSIFGMTLAETSKIQAAIFDIIFASSYAVLKEVVDGIEYVKPPMASEVMAQERNIETYVGTIDFSVMYRDKAYIFVKDNLLRIARIIVSEKSSEDVIYKNAN